MVMLMRGDLIDEVLLGIQRRLCQAVAGQELEGAVDGRVRETGHYGVPPGRPAPVTGGNRMAQRVEDGKALRSHPKAKRPQLRRILAITCHRFIYCN